MASGEGKRISFAGVMVTTLITGCNMEAVYKVNETHLSLTSAVEAGSSYFRDTYKIITSSSAGTVQ